MSKYIYLGYAVITCICAVSGFASSSNAAQARKIAFDTPLPVNVERVKCRMELQNEIGNRQGSGEWSEQAPAATGLKTYRLPTKTFGHWLELTIAQNGSPTLYEVTVESTRELVFGDRCTVTAKLAAGLDFGRTNPDTTADWFDDKKLKLLLGSSRSGIIYIWSPGMVYSSKFLKSFREVARTMKVDFTPIVDPRSRSIEMLAASKEYGFAPVRMKLNSVELYMRNSTTHYPSTVVYKDGRVHSMPIVGVMPAKDIEAEVNRRFQEIESSRTE